LKTQTAINCLGFGIVSQGLAEIPIENRKIDLCKIFS